MRYRWEEGDVDFTFGLSKYSTANSLFAYLLVNSKNST